MATVDMTNRLLTADKNTGHGHVFARPDGVKARCGGPAMCSNCARDFAHQQQTGAVAIDETDPPTCGRWVGQELYWDIGDETISDEDLKRWIRDSFPESSAWRSTAGGIVAYHTRAYANRKRAIEEFMKTLKWAGRS